MYQVYPKMVFAVEIGKGNITTEFCIFKLKENNYIFFAGGGALVYLAEPMHKNAPQHLFGATHLVRT